MLSGNCTADLWDHLDSFRNFAVLKITKYCFYFKRSIVTMTKPEHLPENISLSDFLQAQGELALIIDDSGNCSLMFADCAGLVPCPPRELPGSNIALLFPEAIAARLMEAIGLTQRSGKSSRFDYQLNIAGALHWFEARIAPFSANEVLFLAFDVSAHRETEKRLINSEANLKFILDSTEQSYFLTHMDSRLILMNRSAEGLLSRLDLKRRKPGDKMIRMMPREWLSDIALAFNKAVTGSSSNFLKEIVFKGEPFYFDVEVVPIRGSDNQPNIIAIGMKEMTQPWNMARQLQESEARYRFLTQNVADVIWQMNASGDFSFVSQGVEKFLSYTPSEMVGRSVFRFVTNESAKQIQLVLHNLNMSKDHDEGRLDIQFVGKDGKKNWGEVRYNGVYDRHHQLTDIIGVVRDITCRRETEQALKETSARLLELNRTKDKFFSLIAHDLKNPMCAITGFSQLLEEDFDTMSAEEMRHCVKNINRSATDLNKLLDDLLIWSRTQTGTISYRPERIEVSMLAHSAILLSQLSADKKQILITQEIPPELSVFADLNMAKTVLRNLLGNAIKFSHRRNRVVVTAESDDDFVTIVVTDQGTGMPEQVVENLMNSETQVSNRGTEGESGSGFGLLISREFVEHHGGRLWIQSKPGEGTSIYFTLPAGPLSGYPGK